MNDKGVCRTAPATPGLLKRVQQNNLRQSQLRTKRLCPSGTYGAYGTYGTYGAYGAYGAYGTYGTYVTYDTIGTIG